MANENIYMECSSVIFYHLKHIYYVNYDAWNGCIIYLLIKYKKIYILYFSYIFSYIFLISHINSYQNGNIIIIKKVINPYHNIRNH